MSTFIIRQKVTISIIMMAVVAPAGIWRTLNLCPAPAGLLTGVTPFLAHSIQRSWDSQ